MSPALPPYEPTTTASPPPYGPAPPTVPLRTLSLAPSTLRLPEYTAKPTTEPHTLSRTCFLWGFACPVLWIIAIAILFIDLRYEPDLSIEEGTVVTSVEEQVKRERDAQIVAESIMIIRKVSSPPFFFDYDRIGVLINVAKGGNQMVTLLCCGAWDRDRGRAHRRRRHRRGFPEQVMTGKDERGSRMAWLGEVDFRGLVSGSWENWSMDREG